ncbi:MAG: T9SS type A sorting domain-containing protein [Muribaculum sp.]|nr:T9SS type A sorting domain-containing protein [Muribaculum sp.]
MNKKLLLSGAALLAASTAVAQISDTPVFESENRHFFNVVPADICAGNLPQIIAASDDEIIVLDDNLKEINRFSFPSLTATQTSTGYKAIPILKVSQQEEEPVTEGTKFTLSTALSYLQENYSWMTLKTEEHGPETWFVERYYQEWEYGENFPQDFFKLKEDGSLYRVCMYYHESPIGYTDTWIKSGETESYNYTYNLSNIHLSINGFDTDASIIVSQKLFNDDDNYEYLVPVLTSETREEFWGNCIDGNYSIKKVMTGDFVTGVKLMNDKGTVLQTFDADSAYPDAYIIGKNKYISFDNQTYFRITGNGTGSLTEVTLPSGIQISPRVAQRSTPIDITVGDAATTRTIKVIGTNGMVMTTTEIPAGRNSTTINTSRFPAGMYVVVVNDGDKKVENCKIIIR